MTDWRRLLPYAWSVTLALLLLGPVLGPGYVLSYDMVWVPDLTLRADFLGLGSGLPRAVPSDALVSLLDQVVPAMLLQKLMLLSVLVLGGVGAMRLSDRSSLVAQLMAVSLYQWNPFVAERLLIGHWPVLVGYAALPWVILAAQEWRTTGRLPARLWCLVPLGSLSASAGLVTGLALVAFAASRSTRRLTAVGALLLAANAPWWVAGVLHAQSALTDPAGARFFALRGEGAMPAPLAALGLGGIWNSEVVLPSRTGALGYVSLLVLAVLVGFGMRRWVAATGGRDVRAYLGCWLAGWGIAVLTWLLPDQLAWLAAHVPGAGLVRDGARLLALCAPLLVAAAGHGAARLVAGLVRAARPATVLALLLVPLATMPDVAFGLSGRLSATAYPSDYARARDVLSRTTASEDSPADVLLLPLSSYRQPAWNGGHKVLDPVGRYLEPDFVSADDLYVSGQRVAGEDPRARAVARVLHRGTPGQRSAGLADQGIGYVVTERDAGPSPGVAGQTLMAGNDLSVQALHGATPRAVPVSWKVAMGGAWMLFLGLYLIGALRAARSVLGRVRRRAKCVDQLLE